MYLESQSYVSLVFVGSDTIFTFPFVLQFAVTWDQVIGSCQLPEMIYQVNVRWNCAVYVWNKAITRSTFSRLVDFFHHEVCDGTKRRDAFKDYERYVNNSSMQFLFIVTPKQELIKVLWLLGIDINKVGLLDNIRCDICKHCINCR